MILSKDLTTKEYMHTTVLQNPDDTVTRIISKHAPLKYFCVSAPYFFDLSYLYKPQNALSSSTVRAPGALVKSDACHVRAA